MNYYLNLQEDNLENEEWRPVLGYEEYYLISNLGRFKSLDRYVLTYSFGHGKNVKRLIKGKIRKQFLDIGGYCVSGLSAKGIKTKTMKIHLLVANAFIKKIKGKDFINHIDGNKSNNIVSNLEWVTASENMVHAYKNNLVRISLGENNYMSKFSKEVAKDIYNSPLKGKELAKMYGVKYHTIMAIKRGTNRRSETI